MLKLSDKGNCFEITYKSHPNLFYLCSFLDLIDISVYGFLCRKCPDPDFTHPFAPDQVRRANYCNVKGYAPANGFLEKDLDIALIDKKDHQCKLFKRFPRDPKIRGSKMISLGEAFIGNRDNLERSAVEYLVDLMLRNALPGVDFKMFSDEFNAKFGRSALDRFDERLLCFKKSKTLEFALVLAGVFDPDRKFVFREIISNPYNDVRVTYYMYEKYLDEQGNRKYAAPALPSKNKHERITADVAA